MFCSSREIGLQRQGNILWFTARASIATGVDRGATGPRITTLQRIMRALHFPFGDSDVAGAAMCAQASEGCRRIADGIVAHRIARSAAATDLLP